MKIFPIKVLADDEREIEETFEVILSNAIGAEAIAPPMPIRILDEIEGLRLNTIRRLSANEVQGEPKQLSPASASAASLS